VYGETASDKSGSLSTPLGTPGSTEEQQQHWKLSINKQIRSEANDQALTVTNA